MSFFSPTAILNHFQEYLPRLTGLFSDSVAVSAEIVTGTPQVLSVVEPAHGLSVGKVVVFADGKIDNKISNVQLFADPAGDILRFTTTSSHDLTLDYSGQILLNGFTDTNLNGLFTLVGVPSRTTFEIAYSTLPTLNGNEVLREDWEIGINGVFKIDRVVDVDTYEIDLTGKPIYYPGTVPVLVRVTSMRMSVSLDADRANAGYTKETDPDKLWLYVVMGDATASKNRSIKTDAVNDVTSQNTSDVLMINTFSILVFFPTHKETLGGGASQRAWEEIYLYMLAVGSGAKFESFGRYDSLTTLIFHGSSIYNNGYYVHAYVFEYNNKYTQEQGFLTNFIESRAFRDDKISLFEISDGSELDLDETQT